MDEFKQFLEKDKISLSDSNFKDNLDFIKTHIHVQLVDLMFGQDEADRVGKADDPLVLKALDDMPQAKELLAKAKRYVASETSR